MCGRYFNLSYIYKSRGRFICMRRPALSRRAIKTSCMELLVHCKIGQKRSLYTHLWPHPRNNSPKHAAPKIWAEMSFSYETPKNNTRSITLRGGLFRVYFKTIFDCDIDLSAWGKLCGMRTSFALHHPCNAGTLNTRESPHRARTGKTPSGAQDPCALSNLVTRYSST